MLGSFLTAISTYLSSFMGRCRSSTKPPLSTSGTSDSTASAPPLPLLPIYEPARPSFPQFINLPLEIREMIWKFALPGARELIVLNDPNNLGDFSIFSDAKRHAFKWRAFRNCINFYAPLSQVCFESRRVMQEAGYRLAHAGDDASLPDIGVWFCEERGDTVSIEVPGDPSIICVLNG
ncbi:hypothetical protein F5B21DRAFT_476765 [Xylaria acuta]|nr:hypothetical protein F5B21DRAFT_476765 [Xylaria acuta]